MTRPVDVMFQCRQDIWKYNVSMYCCKKFADGVEPALVSETTCIIYILFSVRCLLNVPRLLSN